jgi:hypothetical protein
MGIFGSGRHHVYIATTAKVKLRQFLCAVGSEQYTGGVGPAAARKAGFVDDLRRHRRSGTESKDVLA